MPKPVFMKVIVDVVVVGCSCSSSSTSGGGGDSRSKGKIPIRQVRDSLLNCFGVNMANQRKLSSDRQPIRQDFPKFFMMKNHIYI